MVLWSGAHAHIAINNLTIIFMPQKKVILILEDEGMLAKALRIMLEDEGFTVTIAQDGTVAVEEVDNSDYDLVLLDLVVPGIDGFEVLKHIRSKGNKPPVFILSNLSQKEDIDKALTLGADKYFVKSDTLLSEITRVVKEAFS